MLQKHFFAIFSTIPFLIFIAMGVLESEWPIILMTAIGYVILTFLYIKYQTSIRRFLLNPDVIRKKSKFTRIHTGLLYLLSIPVLYWLIFKFDAMQQVFTEQQQEVLFVGMIIMQIFYILFAPDYFFRERQDKR